MEGRVGRTGSHAFTTLPPYPRGARSYQSMANQWQVGPWRRGARRHRVLMNMLRLATRRRAVLGATFLDEDDSFGYFNPQIWLSGGVRASA